MKNLKFIIPVFVFALAFGVCGYTKTGNDINPMDVINRINGNGVSSPVKIQPNQITPSPVTTPAKEKVVPAKPDTTQPKTVSQAPLNKDYFEANPIEIVKNPAFYIGKKVKFKAKFDKFSTLGLDYTPAKRSSEDYITLLIQRPDVTSHDIPLSELKIFMNRKEAEKHIDLNSGDEIEIAGKVFAKALGDAWMDVDNFTVLKTFPKPVK